MADVALHPGVTLRLYREEKVFGPGAAELLELVREHRSLRAAAQSREMSYSKAWKVIKTAEQGLGYALLQSSVGGRNGGGASLTPEAESLLTRYRAFEAESKRQIDELYRRYFEGEAQK